jgi:hypothetical protein
LHQTEAELCLSLRNWTITPLSIQNLIHNLYILYSNYFLYHKMAPLNNFIVYFLIFTWIGPCLFGHQASLLCINMLCIFLDEISWHNVDTSFKVHKNINKKSIIYMRLFLTMFQQMMFNLYGETCLKFIIFYTVCIKLMLIAIHLPGWGKKS